ncbi:MAG: MBL fold metallo-hydrolase [Desulfovibrio sp.]
MYIRCWGARGSIPVSGPEYIKYGGDTACLEIRTAANDVVVIVDAGSGLRPLANQLMDEGRHDYTFLFTHAHWDHILGFPFFKPLYSSRNTVHIFGCPISQGNMQTLLSKTMSAPYFPVPFDEVRARIGYQEYCDNPLVIDGMRIETIPLSHPNMGVGFRFTEKDRRFVFLTDNELGFRHPGGRTFDEYVQFCEDADLIIHDAEYTPEDYLKRRGWGHSTYEQAVELALAAGAGMLGLFHHNQDRPDTEVDAIVARSSDLIRLRGVGLPCFGVSQTWSVRL